jgi:sec-independent protein translocase protein TatA
MFPSLQPGEMIVIGLIAVLLFGKRLPEVGKMLGRGIVEFKKGLRGEDDDGPGGVSSVPARKGRPTPTVPPENPEVPRFEPPTAPPTFETPYGAPTYRD